MQTASVANFDDNLYQTTLDSKNHFCKRNVIVFRNKTNNKMLYINQSNSARSLFRLKRRIKQNSDAMKNDFKTFFTFTYDNLHVYTKEASKNISDFMIAFRYYLIEKNQIMNFKDLKYLWKVEWGSHEFTSRIHLHMLCNIEFSFFEKQIKALRIRNKLAKKTNHKKKSLRFVNLWGRGIAQVLEIKENISKKTNKHYSKEENVLSYLFKYFAKDQKSQKKLKGYTSRRWGTSTHYKSNSNIEWEHILSEKVESEQQERELLEYLASKYANDSYSYEYDNNNEITYRYHIKNKLVDQDKNYQKLIARVKQNRDSLNLNEYREFMINLCSENDYDYKIESEYKLCCLSEFKNYQKEKNREKKEKIRIDAKKSFFEKYLLIEDSHKF